MNLLYNGGFDGNLYRWTGAGTIDRANGYPRLGCVSLAAGQSIQTDQDIGIGENYLHTLHFFYQLSTGATLTATYGSISQAFTGAPLDVWREGVLNFALDTGGSDPVVFSASGGAAKVDSVTLMIGALPIKRASIAAAVAARMTSLVSDASLSATASTAGPEGDYSLAIDEALRALGAVNSWGDPDVTMLESGEVNGAIDATQNALLVRLQATYTLKSDVTLGPRTERQSQIAASIAAMLGGGAKGGGGRVGVNRLSNGDWPR